MSDLTFGSLANDKPYQILGVFIRHADEADPLDDPTGKGAMGDAGLHSAPLIPPTPPDENITPRPRRARTLTDTSSSSRTGSEHPLRMHVTPTSYEPGQSPPTSPPPDYFSIPRYNVEPEEMLDGELSASPSSDLFPPLTPSSAQTQSTPKSSSTSGSSASSRSRIYPLMKSSSTSSAYSRLSEPEKRRYDLQMRVYRARMHVPRHIPLRVFKTPQECVEVEGLLKRNTPVGTS